jgi:bifunctional DNase/RNase
MAAIATSGLLALPVALAAAAALAAGARAAPAPGGHAGRAAHAHAHAAAPRRAAQTDRIELEVVGVLPVSDEGASVVVLREKGAARILPLLVPAQTGRSVEARLRPGPTRPPPTLLDRTIDALGAKVVEVELDGSEESGSGATVRLSQGSRALEITARASESVALAVAQGARIVALRGLLEAEGLDQDDLARLRRGRREREEKTATRL